MEDQVVVELEHMRVEVEIVINQTLQVFQVQQKEMLAELETLLLAIVEQVVAAMVLALLVRQEY